MQVRLDKELRTKEKLAESAERWIERFDKWSGNGSNSPGNDYGAPTLAQITLTQVKRKLIA